MKSTDNKWMDSIQGLSDSDDDMYDVLLEMEVQKPKSSEMKSGSHTEDIADMEVFVHASSSSKFMSGKFGLSDVQSSKLSTLLERKNGAMIAASDDKGKPYKPLTDNMEAELQDLIDRRDNPKLGKTVRTAIEESLTAQSYKVEKNTNSKYTNHGIANEPFSITQLNAVTGRNFKKCEETKTDCDLLLRGTPDIVCDETDCIIDIKNPYDAFTFNKQRAFELTDRTTGDPNLDAAQKEYYHQMQAYMVLFDKPVAYLVFTLNENDYMAGDEYDEFGALDRLIIKKVLKDPEWIIEYTRRLEAYKDTVLDVKISRKESMVATGDYLTELSK